MREGGLSHRRDFGLTLTFRRRVVDHVVVEEGPYRLIDPIVS